ncbi:hypothetical protein AAF712_009490 [Marasmius tenuissimus]|uniref:Uncharacterized protein n=1 Tax=Marasmius tenuissimus TaxID=585030 RepID=A0ABR2ZS61_9AGAR|nr:hypothetical protein PM082_024255 [Marasmius tenuissimus]
MSAAPPPTSGISNAQLTVVYDQTTLPPLSSNSGNESDEDDDIPPLQTDTTPTATNVVNPENTSWGTGRVGWDGFEETERGWASYLPRTTSLKVRESGWGDDASEFRWRSPATSDHHVTHFTREDLSKTLVPTGPEQPSALDDAPNDQWARTQLIRSLHDAQQRRIPGPTFTLSQVARRLAEIQAGILDARVKVSQNELEINSICDRQTQLYAEANRLDEQIHAIKNRSSELEAQIGRLSGVEMDLQDLESIALVYC